MTGPLLPSWSLRVRLAAIVVGALVITAGVGSTTGWALWRTAQATRNQQDQVVPAVSDARALTTALLDQETGERGYLITGQLAFLTPYRQGRAQTTLMMARLRREIGGERDFASLIDGIESSYRVWLTGTAEPEIAAVARGDSAAAVEQESTGAGKAHFDVIRVRLDALSGAVETRLTRADSKVHDDTEIAFVLAVGSALAILIGSILALGALRAWVNRPIERLGAMVRRVAAGELGEPVEQVGPPEIARLAADVEAMRRRLLDEVDEVRQAREAVEQQGPAVELVRRALLPSAQTLASPIVTGRLIPAEGFLAGDWYDTRTTPRGTLMVAVMDVSGHGPAAGLFALRLKELCRVAVGDGLGPADLVAWVSAQIGTGSERFATAVVMELDLEQRTAAVAVAGHPPVLWRHGTGDARVTELNGTGMVIGMVAGEWHQHEITLGDDDLLLVYTDGLTEARDADGELFGIEGVSRVLAGADGVDPSELIGTLVDAARRHSDGPIADDLTIVAVALDRAHPASSAPPGPTEVARSSGPPPGPERRG